MVNIQIDGLTLVISCLFECDDSSIDTLKMLIYPAAYSDLFDDAVIAYLFRTV